MARLVDFIFLDPSRQFESPILALSSTRSGARELAIIPRTAESRPVAGETLGAAARICVAEKHRSVLYIDISGHKSMLQLN
jgi:hypothetical protein